MRIAVNNPHPVLPKRNLNINLKFKVMKKVRKLCHSGTNREFFNLFRVTKVVFMIMLLGLTHVSATVVSQTVLNLKLKDVTLEEAVQGAEKQLKRDFFFNKQEIDVNRKVTVELENGTLADFVRVVFGKDYSYEVVDNVIVISYKPVTQEQVKAVTITGKVMDKDSVPLPGVTVLVKGTGTGTATDVNGEYKLSLPERASIVLEFSFIGMKTKTVTYTGQKTINVVLEEDVNQMEEVVVTGYQKIERRKLTSSITTVDMDRLQMVNQPSIDKLLQGQVPGMTIVSTSGAPGAVPQIRIRGTSTISGNVQPLWVVDGIVLEDPVDANVDDLLNNRNLIASGIGGVNVDDIESINVLKDAAATAIYGTRAANGVIVITSKKGTVGKTRVTYNGSISIGMRPKLKDAYMLNSKERVDINMEMLEKGLLKATSNKAGEYGTVSDFERYFIDVHDHKLTWEQFQQRVNQLETVNTDWFKHLFRNSITHRHSVSISGGSEATTFYLSGSYMDEQATAKDVGLETYTMAAKVFTKLRHNLRVGGMLDVNMRNNKSFFAVDSRENPYEWAIYTTRAHNAYDENGNFNYMYYNDLKFNFLENRDQSWRRSKSYGLKGTVDIEWKILPDLTFSSLFSFSKQNTTDVDIATEDSYFVRARQKTMQDNTTYENVWHDGGYRRSRGTNNTSLTFRNQIAYMPVINENHRFDVMVGQEIRKSRYEEETTQIYGYAHDRGHQQILQLDLMAKIGEPYWVENLNESAAVSWFGVAGYTFMNRYTVSFNARTDGSNRFGVKSNDLFQPLWSIGFNYQVKEENFLQNVKWLTYLTLKGSYGSQGNMADAYSDLVAKVGKIDAVKNENYLTIEAPKNPNLKWEKNYSTNLALEFGLFNQRIYGSLEYYYKKAVDLLGKKQVSLVSGFSSVSVNWASMKNTGWEFALNTVNIKLKDFRWTSNLNFGYNYNEILDVYSTPTYGSMTDAQRTDYASAAIVGKPINGLWSYRYAGLNEDGRAQFYDAEGEKVLKGMNDVEGLKYSGTTMPLVQGGFTNTFEYKGLTLSVLLVGNFGNVIRLRNMTSGQAFAYPEATQNMSKEWARRWRKPGDEAYTDVPRLEETEFEDAVFYPYPSNGTMYNNSDLRTVKGDFVRLQNLSLSYQLNSKRLKDWGIQNVRFMLQGNNLHVWKNSKLKGQDPEATGAIMKYSSASNANVSFGNTYLPLPRSYTFSVSVQF